MFPIFKDFIDEFYGDISEIFLYYIVRFINIWKILLTW